MKPLGAGGADQGAKAETARRAAVEAVVFDGDTRAALAVVRSLGRRGVRITVAASRSGRSPGLRAMRRSHPGARSGARAGGIRRRAEALARARPGALWVPVTDATLAGIDSRPERAPSFRILLPEASALAIAWDKGRLLAAAAAAAFGCRAPGPPGEPAALARARARPRLSRWC